MPTKLKRWLPLLVAGAVLSVAGRYAFEVGKAYAAASARAVEISNIVLRLNGSVKPLGVIAETAGTPKDNGTTAAPFTIPVGATICIRCSAAAYVQQVSAASWPGDANVVDFIQANQRFCESLDDQRAATIAVDFASGTNTCNVGQMF